MVPSPVVAVIMLFPVTEKSKAVTQEGVLCLLSAVHELTNNRFLVVKLTLALPVDAEDGKLKADGCKGGPASLYFMKQTISNACGTIGVLHAIGNNSDKADLGAVPAHPLPRFTTTSVHGTACVPSVLLGCRQA